MHKYIDLRSDTVTVPTDAMKDMSFSAMLGDDVYGDDPTVNKLEKFTANLLGKEAALFVPSGTFGNQLALLTHTLRGDEVIVASNSHILIDEVAAASVIAGVQLRTFTLQDGNRLPMNEINSLYRLEDIHFPNTGLICLENAISNGKIIPLEDMKELRAWATNKNVPIHLDGARLFNAAIAMGVEAREIAAQVDSVNVCLSKGLCAPIGSILVGNKKFIDKARKNRKLMGGGMRQAGIIAAPALYAIEYMTSRLKEDHDLAKYMAQRLSKIPRIDVNIDDVHINMVFFSMDLGDVSEDDLIGQLATKKIKINGSEDGMFRFVTHNDIDKSDVDLVVDMLQEILA